MESEGEIIPIGGGLRSNTRRFGIDHTTSQWCFRRDRKLAASIIFSKKRGEELGTTFLGGGDL